MTEHIVHALVGDARGVADAVIKTTALFLTATVLLRFTERRTLAEFAPFDWIAAVAAGAIVGRAATAVDTSWLAATAALISLLLAHAALARLRFMPAFQRFIDPPLLVLIHDGRVDRRNLRRCGLTSADSASGATPARPPQRRQHPPRCLRSQRSDLGRTLPEGPHGPIRPGG